MLEALDLAPLFSVYS